MLGSFIRLAKVLGRGGAAMKKLVGAIVISMSLIAGMSFLPDNSTAAYAQKKDDKDKRRNPPGPPIVKPKGGGDSGKKDNPPPKRRPNG